MFFVHHAVCYHFLLTFMPDANAKFNSHQHVTELNAPLQFRNLVIHDFCAAVFTLHMSRCMRCLIAAFTSWRCRMRNVSLVSTSIDWVIDQSVKQSATAKTHKTLLPYSEVCSLGEEEHCAEASIETN